jgi:hypothetical protein
MARTVGSYSWHETRRVQDSVNAAWRQEIDMSSKTLLMEFPESDDSTLVDSNPTRANPH